MKTIVAKYISIHNGVLDVWVVEEDVTMELTVPLKSIIHVKTNVSDPVTSIFVAVSEHVHYSFEGSHETVVAADLAFREYCRK